MKNYETVKTANGYKITRMIGTKNFYHVKLSDNKEMTFKTIKAAAEFCKTLPYKPIKCATAIGMVRTALGYVRKETLIFTLTDDSKATKKLVDEFAKKHSLHIVEVWYRNDNEWDKVIPYKVYSYLPTVDGDKLNKLKG
jgi:ribosomal protein L10